MTTQEPPRFLVRIRLEGSPDAIEALGRLLAPCEASPIASVDGEHWIALQASSGPPSRLVEAFRDFLAVANGVIDLWGNIPGNLRVLGFNYVDSATGRSKGVLFNAYGIGRRPSVEALSQPARDDIPLGVAAIRLAQSDRDVTLALSIIGTGVADWWQIYMLLEILRDRLATPPGRLQGDWALLFKRLRQATGHSAASLERLRQTANFHRHANSPLPKNPWKRHEAAAFVQGAIRDWLFSMLRA